MQIYQHDAMMHADDQSYVGSYDGFKMEREYETPLVFSSRRIARGDDWPNQKVRDMWAKLRKVQYTTVPGAPR